jgi:uncharacterized RDD family membrane protein YckC
VHLDRALVLRANSRFLPFALLRVGMTMLFLLAALLLLALLRPALFLLAMRPLIAMLLARNRFGRRRCRG